MEATDLSNVVLSDKLKARLVAFNSDKPTVRVSAHPLLEPVIYKLALANPLWSFVASSNDAVSAAYDVVLLNYFTVMCDGEELGVIRRKFERRDYQICVVNDRIARSMERSPYHYKTTDPVKAIAKVRKYFSPKSHIERIEAASKMAGDVSREADWAKGRELRESTEIIKRAAEAYVMSEGFSAFMDYMKEHKPTEYEVLRKAEATAASAREDAKTISAVQLFMSKGSVAGMLVHRVGGTYLVRENNQPAVTYTDATLTPRMRMSLGMLKLVEPKQFVTGIGMKADDNTFVLIGDDLTNVMDTDEGV